MASSVRSNGAGLARNMSAPAFNASVALDNAADMACHGATTTIPLAPRDSKLLLLDIEGTTTSISFVKDVLFPYVLNNLDDYVGKMGATSDLLDALRGDVDALGDDHPAKVELSGGPAAADDDEVIKLIVKTMMKHDVKATVSSVREISDFHLGRTGLTTNSHETQMRKKIS